MHQEKPFTLLRGCPQLTHQNNHNQRCKGHQEKSQQTHQQETLHISPQYSMSPDMPCKSTVNTSMQSCKQLKGHTVTSLHSSTSPAHYIPT